MDSQEENIINPFKHNQLQINEKNSNSNPFLSNTQKEYSLEYQENSSGRSNSKPFFILPLPLFIQIKDKSKKTYIQSINKIEEFLMLNTIYSFNTSSFNDNNDLPCDISKLEEDVYLNDSLTEETFEIKFRELLNLNTKNELNHLFILENINGEKVKIKKCMIKSLIDKAIRCLPLKTTEEVYDIDLNKQLIPNTQIIKLIDNCRMAEILIKNQGVSYIEVCDLKRNSYVIKKSKLIEIFDNIKHGKPPLKKEEFITIEGKHIQLNPYSLRLPKQMNIENEIPTTPKSIRLKTEPKKSLLSKDKKKFQYKGQPYTLIDKENKIFYEVTNLKKKKFELLPESTIIQLIFSNENSNSNSNEEYNKDEIKLVLNEHNNKNIYIKIYENIFILKKYIDDIIHLLLQNKKIPEKLNVENYKGGNVEIQITDFLLSNYQIAPSSYIKDAFLKSEDITYYENSSGTMVQKSKVPYLEISNFSSPGIELFEYLKIEDINGSNCFIRKPFIRNFLYTQNFCDDFNIIDMNNNNRTISLIKIINKYNEKAALQLVESVLINDQIKNCKFYLEIKDNKGKVHLVSKEKILLGNEIMKNEKDNVCVSLTDVKGKIFSPLIEKNTIKMVNKREWVKVKNADDKEIFVYKSVVKHILQENKQELNRDIDNFISVIDYYCHQEKINKEKIRREINEVSNKEKQNIIILKEKINKKKE